MSKPFTAAFTQQIAACEMLGSPLTAELVAVLGDDFAKGGVIAELLADWAGEPVDDNIALRLAGFVHFMALGGAAALQPFFASCGGAYQPRDKPALRQAVITLFQDNMAAARDFLRTAPQTNESGRAGVLLIGFSEIARRAQCPLSICEIGASAGLNLNFDRFRYEIATDSGTLTWGPADSPLTITPRWQGTPPALCREIAVAGRYGCDLFPIDITDSVARRRLEAYIWGDQTARRARLLAALQIAAAHPPPLDACDAADWLAAQLAAHPSGQCFVLYHSIVWPYLAAEQRRAIEAAMQQAGAAACRDRPIAWLQMDHAHIQAISELSYRFWNGDNGATGEKILIGACHPHGAHIELADIF